MNEQRNDPDGGKLCLSLKTAETFVYWQGSTCVSLNGIFTRSR
ncbi:hypothetical protein [Lusitaniella coriacea]|nr:hypothetical protein [Lusitaniella coriacea]